MRFTSRKVRQMVAAEDVDYSMVNPTERIAFFFADGTPINFRIHGVPNGGLPTQVLVKTSETDGETTWGDVVALIGAEKLVPTGGTGGQVLTKFNEEDYILSWADPAASLPEGGTTGQVLAKASDADNDVEWVDPPSTSFWAGEFSEDTNYAANQLVRDDDKLWVTKEAVESSSTHPYASDPLDPVTDNPPGGWDQDPWQPAKAGQNDIASTSAPYSAYVEVLTPGTLTVIIPMGAQYSHIIDSLGNDTQSPAIGAPASVAVTPGRYYLWMQDGYGAAIDKYIVALTDGATIQGSSPWELVYG